MIAENIEGKWICEGEEVNPYLWELRCFHEDKWFKFETVEEMNNFLNQFYVSEES